MSKRERGKGEKERRLNSRASSTGSAASDMTMSNTEVSASLAGNERKKISQN